MGKLKFGYQTLCWLTYEPKMYQVDECIREVHEAGFRGLEFAQQLQHFERCPEYKDVLDKLGMVVASFSCGISYEPNDTMDVTKKRADFASQFGVKALMICGGWGTEWRLKSEEQYVNLANNLDRLAEYLKKYDMLPAFHPHIGTIVETYEDTERLLSKSKYTQICLDSAHFALAGGDPIKLYENYRDRVGLIHIKDWEENPDFEMGGKKGRFVELGEGNLTGIDNFLNTLQDAEFDGWVMLEVDKTYRPPLESAKMNYKYLHDRGYI